MMRELKGMESMSSSRLLMELGGAAFRGSLPTLSTSWCVACPYETGEAEGLGCDAGGVGFIFAGSLRS